MRFLVVLLAGARAQGPFNGMSKSTVAAETDPLGAMAFVQKHFGATPDSDSCAGNVCACSAGDSGAAAAWSAVLGRCDLVKAGYPAGACELRTAVSGVVDAPADAADAVAVTPPAGPLGDADCAYSRAGSLYAPAAGDAGYVVRAHDADTCCKSCTALEGCAGATWRPAGAYSADDDGGGAAAARLGGPPHYEGFGLHMPAIAGHVTTGGLPVATVEAIVASKLSDLATRFDAWLDFSVALFTTDLDGYLRSLRADGAPYLATRWRAPPGAASAAAALGADGGELFSVFVHVPRSQLVLELVAATSATLAPARDGLAALEPRLPATRLAAVAAAPPARGDLLLPVRVSRAATDLDALDAFYGADGMRANLTLALDGADGGAAARCYLWPSGNVDLCFVRRDDAATAGAFKVGDFERMLRNASATSVTTPLCQMNRWADNHYALDVADGSFDYVVDYLEEHPDVLYQCGPAGTPMSGLHYVYDPTGWVVQLNVNITKLPRGCDVADDDDAAASSSPMCDGGTCS